ncbi:RB-associated KRAB zinc finger isoform X1 [Brachionus plicatilis]|uniref:RB-associated KRAB zinc finger isoform X1 n=1 Tax=Brachionus plicatilis TaxID=10195 RepID=A0A3M7P6T9_BRAPC|nr:RB-associated KRAB zinc finger isoform X1 [Brachionus plicatilis]
MINKDVMQKLDLFNSKYKCIICRKRLRYKADEIIHSQIIHNPANPKNMCPYCHKMFQSCHKLRIHLMKIHLNEKPYRCRLCSKKFVQFVHLKKHCKKHVRTQMPFCSMIDYENSTIEHPTSNNWRKKEKNFVQFFIVVGNSVKKCKECCANFVSDSEYLVHIWTEHMKSNCLICWQCRCTFSSVQDLTLHLGEHLQEKNFKCSLCSSRDKCIFFGTLEKAKDHYVKVHLQSKHSPLFKLVCCVCDQFIDESNINSHYKQCSVKAKPTFYCAQCSFTFEDPQLYELHKSQHRFLQEQMLPFNTSYLIDSIISPHVSYGNRSVNGLKIDDIALKILSMKQKKIDFEREETLVQYSPFLIHPNEHNSICHPNKLSRLSNDPSD